VLLCRRHHRMAHREHWQIRVTAGRAEFVPPTWIDSAQGGAGRPRPPSDEPPEASSAGTSAAAGPDVSRARRGTIAPGVPLTSRS
jgi:hypothetical protein